ncbi:hypothetical protein EMPS_07104 [Entomortierella parvispora]|uniref:RNI-like protein n=1 Tax=Entomortierella parvispora TaxID=205924 RepID=A0A9P3HDT0_9FUNG|nr:hypothetical protein EMPS_07104 [Entomortierella parvispora]
MAHFPRLIELTTEQDRRSIRYRKLSPLNWFLKQNLPPFIVEHRATLKILVLNVSQSQALTDATMACSQLESLTTRHPCMGNNQDLEDWMNWYESLAVRLKSLSFIDMSMVSNNIDSIMDDAMDGLLSKTRESTLQRLQLQSEGISLTSLRVLMLLIMKSPELRHLSLAILHDKGAITRLAEAVEKTQRGLFCQKLESLSIQHGHFNLTEFKRVMDSLPALKNLSLFGCGASSSPIAPFLTTLNLRRLRVEGCPWASPTTIQDLLCSMPSLEVLAVNCVSDLAIQKDPRPWVCTELKELSTAIEISLGLDGITLILDRLATLRRLETLNVQRAYSFTTVDEINEYQDNDVNTRVHELPLMLEWGLDRLETLTQLRVLGVDNGLTKWGKDEAHWALENWTHLISLNVAADDEARSLLLHRIP